MKNKILLFATLLLLPMLAMAQNTKKKVAVYVIGEDAGLNKVIGNKLVSAIIYDNRYTAIERTNAFLAQLSKEHNYQHSGVVDDKELSHLGKQFGAQYICIATVSDAFNGKYLSARLIDVESAQVVSTSSRSLPIQSLSDVSYAANELSHNLLHYYHTSNQSNSPKVAVYVIKNDAAKDISKVLGDKLVEGFTNSGRYVAIERTNSFLAQLSKEQKYQRTGAVDDSEISRLGKQFGVQYVCVAEVSDVFDEKFISARLIDVETAEIVNSHDDGGAIKQMDDCVRIADNIASKLSKGTLEEQAKEEAKLFDVVERMPEFPGGQAALLKWISDHIKYPAVAEENGIQGRVVCTFIVERDGSITNIQVVRSVDSSLDKEAIRVLKMMPRWNPGNQNGSLVRVKYTVPVTFRLQDDTVKKKKSLLNLFKIKK
jgi:TonB family protein